MRKKESKGDQGEGVKSGVCLRVKSRGKKNKRAVTRSSTKSKGEKLNEGEEVGGGWWA